MYSSGIILIYDDLKRYDGSFLTIVGYDWGSRVLYGKTMIL